MGEGQKYIDVEDFNNWKRKQGKAYKIPPRANLLAAANHIKNVFDSKKFNWAAFGGLAMLCLGSRRQQPDLHIVYDDRDFQRIKMKLEGDQRVRLPKSMNSLFPSKLLVSTGPKYKDVGCTENAEIEVDLVPPGSHGTPPNDVLRNNQAMLRLNREGGKVDNFKGLNMLYLVKTTIYYCKSQDLVWDPKMDVLFLCQNYGKEIEFIRTQLNVQQVQENFLGTTFVARLSPEDQRRCYQVLLGKEPPPAMSITPPTFPPGHRPTASASEPNTRPRIASHKSSPSLNNAAQQPSSFLSPPLPGNPKAVPGAPKSAPPTQTFAPPGPPPSTIAVNSAGDRDPRSRYRHTSAPNTPSASRNGSPEQQNAHRPRSMDVRPQQQAVPSYKAQPVSLHNSAHVPRPQMVSGHAPAPMAAFPTGMRPQKSMPDISGRSTGTVPVYAHSQNAIPPVPKVPAIPPPYNSAITTSPMFPASQRTQPRGSPPVMPHDVKSQSISPSAAGNNSQAISQPHQQRNDIRQAQQANNVHDINSRHRMASASYHADASARGLKIVGPEGLYPSPLKPGPRSQQDRTMAPSRQVETRATASNFVFELDASSPQAASASQPNITHGFIAELPAEMDGPSPPAGPKAQQPLSYAEMQVSPPQGPAQIASTRTGQYEVSPISPPLDHHPVPAPFQSMQHEPQARPSNPRTQTPPFDGLPASLMIGGQGPNRRSPSNSFSQPPLQATNPHTNASKYQRYYSPPSSAPNSTQPSPKQTPVSSYKAYSGHVSPQLQPATAPAKLQKTPPKTHVQASLPTSRPQGPTYGSAPNVNAPPPSALRAGPQGPPPQKSLPFHLPNPLGANPPTPPITSLAKHDSHQGLKDHAMKGGPTAAAGVGMIGGTGYATHSYQTSEYNEIHTTQYQSSEEVRYIPFGGPQEQQHNHAEQNYFVSPLTHSAYEPGHQRNVSHDSQTSTTSHDSEKLAKEYQMDLPDFDNGYGSDDRRSHHEYDLGYDFT